MVLGFCSTTRCAHIPTCFHGHRRGLCVVVWLLAAGCAGGPAPRYEQPTAVPDTGATVAAGDVFEVAVYGEKELSGRYRVSRDGTINFPLVGPIDVDGKDQTAVALAIQNALKDQNYLRNPHVSVLVTDLDSKRITVVGAVDKPDSFHVTRGMTVVHAISMAGGFTPLADQNGTIVTRKVDGKTHRFKVPVGRITEGREEPFELRAGDTVYVPERLF